MRRDFLVPALNELGLTVPVKPDGAFYVWADCSRHSSNSWDFAFDLMRRAHVAVTPGRDFGRHGSERYLRFSYASSMNHLRLAVDRIRSALSQAQRSTPSASPES
ncbi:aminotransferase class I/II-fold pyridoxal phosphate-dependent enzyme, partial [Piscinibacter sp.]|uniref:aminotransferase class I/II-fold pyridoxal phosphate-dependent enzyme n=1 Tax=Piscinibacter sp. TaxID=1903157 RepID=UPI002BAB3DF6